MGQILAVCGMNGAGKTTFARAFARKIGCPFVDSEDLYFPDRSGDNPFAVQRGPEEIRALLEGLLRKEGRFVLASVRANFGVELRERLLGVILVETPRETRLKRMRQRDALRFGDKVAPGGEPFAQQEAFYRLAESRREDEAEQWVAGMTCPVLRVDGTKAVAENIAAAETWLDNFTA